MILRITIASGRVPAALQDPAAWPEPMRREWSGDQGAAAARALAAGPWRDLHAGEMEASGRHELRNRICLAGAMHALGRRAEIVDWVETYVFNSSKCFAVVSCS